MNNYTTLTRYKAATPRSARRQKGYTVPTISLPSGNSVSLGGVVMLSGEQTITSIKDYLAGIKIGGLLVYSSKPDTIFVDANLVVRGAVTMYGDNGTTAPSIFDTLPIDNETIKRNANGELYAVGGGGSGTGGLDLVQLDEYLTTNGYATQSWVTGKGYITSSALEPYALKTAIPTNTNQLTNGAGYITGITGTMVTTALGYTPYNSANFTKENIKSTLGISDWALASVRPSYTASDVGALSLTGGTVNGAVSIEGIYYSTGTVSVGSKVGLSLGDKYYGTSIWTEGSGKGYIQQQRFDGSTTTYAFCLQPFGNNVAVGGTTAEAKLHVHGDAKVSGQIYLGGVLRNANGEWLLGESSANGGVFVGTSSYAAERALISSHGKLSLTAEGGVEAQLPFLYSNPSIGALDNNGVFRLVTSYGWGIYAWVRNTGNSYVQVGTDSRYSNPSVNNLILQGLGGNVAIGGETASEKLHVYGNLLVTGGVTMYYSSDQRLKQNIRKVNASKMLMSLGGVYEYEYIDSEVQKNHIYAGTHYGLIYQNVKGTSLNKMCHKREDGMGALNYLDTNFISLIAGATMENISEVEKLKRKIRSLENKVKQLERVA